MAVTIVQTEKLMHTQTYKVTITADGSATIKMPDKCVRAIGFSSDGVDGSGTLTWFVSNDDSTYTALGVNTSADPANPVAVTSASAAGAWIVHEHDLAWRYFKFTLSSSTNPTLVLYFTVMTE